MLKVYKFLEHIFKTGSVAIYIIIFSLISFAWQNCIIITIIKQVISRLAHKNQRDLMWISFTQWRLKSHLTNSSFMNSDLGSTVIIAINVILLVVCQHVLTWPDVLLYCTNKILQAQRQYGPIWCLKGSVMTAQGHEIGLYRNSNGANAWLILLYVCARFQRSGNYVQTNTSCH